MNAAQKKRTESLQKEFEDFFALPCPRQLTPAVETMLNKSASLFLYRLMSIYSAAFFLIIAVALILWQQGVNIPPAIYIIIPLFLTASVVISFVSRSIFNKSKRNLTHGQLYPAKILAIKQTSCHSKGEHFFKATLSIQTPEEGEIKCHDLVGSLSVEYFLDKRDNAQTVDTAYYPNSSRRCTLIRKFITSARFD